MKLFPCVRFLAPCLLLPAILWMVPTQPVEAKTAKLLDIADTIANNRILTKLAGIMTGADLNTFFSSKGPFTFFAPTDAAFAKLPPGALDDLLQPQNKERLQDILLFHAVNGKKLMAKDLLPLTSLLSCNGNPLTLKTSKTGTQFILKAKIVHADIHCANGVIHEIDTVLMPPESSLPPLAPPPTPAPSPAPVTNAPAANPPTDTNAPPSPSTNTNASPVITPEPAAPTDTNATPAAPTTNAPSAETNASPVITPTAADSNAAPVVSIAPTAAPETSPH